MSFRSLLETTKPFFVNGIRLPALQTLLLFAKDIKTDHTCTRFEIPDISLSINLIYLYFWLYHDFKYIPQELIAYTNRLSVLILRLNASYCGTSLTLLS